MSKSPIAYIELPSKNVAADKRFYGSLFGWSFEDFGPDYAAIHDAGVEGGLNATEEGRTKAPLVVLDTDDIEGMSRRVVTGGGPITAPIFACPGGRSIRYTGPSGNELAVMQA